MKVTGIILMLLGALGECMTVVPIIRTFHLLQATGGSVKPSDLAEGIRFALMWSFAGVLLFIIGVVLLIVGLVRGRRLAVGFPVTLPQSDNRVQT